VVNQSIQDGVRTRVVVSLSHATFILRSFSVQVLSSGLRPVLQLNSAQRLPWSEEEVGSPSPTGDGGGSG
jgi:hypothetical protein